MKIILQQDIPKVGKVGEVVTVADGYARNFLFPRAFAVPATGGALKQHNARAAQEASKGARMLDQARATAARLEATPVIITARVGAGSKLYGSITAADLATAAKQATGVELDRRRIALVDPIKNLGTYSISVRLHADVSVNLKVEVLTAEELVRRQSQPVVSEPAPAE